MVWKMAPIRQEVIASPESCLKVRLYFVIQIGLCDVKTQAAVVTFCMSEQEPSILLHRCLNRKFLSWPKHSLTNSEQCKYGMITRNVPVWVPESLYI